MGMKCIRCGTDNNLRERTNNQGRCKNCGHPFAFEPAIMKEVKFTDGFFAKAINDISANETLYFTPKQLSYLLGKRINKKKSFLSPRFLVRSGVFLLFIIISVIYNKKILFPIIVVYGLTILPLFLPDELKLRKNRNELILNKSSNFILTQEQFQDWINFWLRVNQIPKMLPSPSEESASTPVSSDISAYSFDRAVICESAAIAQVLIANNFHFENNCAVLSITGYPQSIFGTVMLMLRRNPELKVYAIHNASPSGVALVHHLRTSLDWFANSNVTIYELGLLPRQIFSKPNLFVQTSQESGQQAKQLPEQVRQSLSSDELKWLEEGKFLELESFSPRKIIQILNQGIARSQDSTATVDSFG